MCGDKKAHFDPVESVVPGELVREGGDQRPALVLIRWREELHAPPSESRRGEIRKSRAEPDRRQVRIPTYPEVITTS